MGDHIHTGRVVAEDDDILSYECERCGAEWQEEKSGPVTYKVVRRLWAPKTAKNGAGVKNLGEGLTRESAEALLSQHREYYWSRFNRVETFDNGYKTTNRRGIVVQVTIEEE